MPTGLPQTKADYNAGSNFDRTGQWVIAKYLDCAWVTGIVQDSRVKYGGTVQHKIITDSPTFIGGADLVDGILTRREELRNIGSIFLVEERNITCAQKENT